MAFGEPVMPPVEASLYEAALDRLEAIDRRLALAASVVPLLHPGAPAVGEEILRYATWRFAGRDVLEAYARRAEALAELQQRFDADPRPQTLGAPDRPVERDLYNLSLLLSIAFTNHRFEIMQQLDAFLLGCAAETGRIASIGTGTGYELRRMALRLSPGWTIESYDIERLVQDEAGAFLRYFGISRPVRWGHEFPLSRPSSEFLRQYDAIVMCELLEHLSHPQTALDAVRACLTPHGRVFATMAINIAQEDHVFLYPDIASCRAQVRAAGFVTDSEWIAPQTTLPPAADREAGFRRGNYMAVLRVAEDMPAGGGQ